MRHGEKDKAAWWVAGWRRRFDREVQHTFAVERNRVRWDATTGRFLKACKRYASALRGRPVALPAMVTRYKVMGWVMAGAPCPGKEGA